MIKEINFNVYRKLKDISITLGPHINVISGSNGTCKSSILHIASNSFKSVSSTDDKVNDINSLKVISQLNKLANPKIESLTRGDKEYNDPASGISGVLYKCTYADEYELSFRRHNTTNSSKKRFAVKPQYGKGSGDSLPKLPIIYLGLFRLFSYGEFSSDESIKNISTTLPEEYITELQEMYFDFTGYKIDINTMFSMGTIKNRPDFSTNQPGVDSNTISAGEDNLFIILLSLLSLKYYYNSITSDQTIESMLLIDEFDATLHPSFQIKLFDIIRKFSLNYKIQVIFTSHSLSLIEHSLKTRSSTNLIYLIDDIFKVSTMKDPDIYKIEMYLNELTKNESYIDNLIPIFTEDNEAREFLKILFIHYKNQTGKNITDYFHIVNASFSSETIKSLAGDTILLRSTLRSINILDGDQHSDENLNNQLIVLPGKKEPESLIFEYSKDLLHSETTKFWDNEVLRNSGYNRLYYRNIILRDIENIDQQISDTKENQKSTKGKRRELNKKTFNSYLQFWRYVIEDWIKNPNNKHEVSKFYNQLNICFKKAAEFHGVSSNDWVNNYGQE